MVRYISKNMRWGVAALAFGGLLLLQSIPSAEAAALKAIFPASLSKWDVAAAAPAEDDEFAVGVKARASTSTTDTEESADYVVIFHPHVSHEKRGLHHEWVGDLLSRSYDSSSTDDEAEQLTIKSGIKGYLNTSSIQGYYGNFHSSVASHISKSTDIAIVEKDSYDQIQDFVYLQYNTPWGLDRISHKEFSSTDGSGTGSYVFNNHGGANTTLYILDSGVRADHREFNGRVRWGANYVDDESNDDQGHGTIIAGIAAGYNVGVAKFANIVSVKVIDSQRRASISRIIQGISWIIDDHQSNPGQKSVINYSAVGSISSSRSLAIQQAVAAGIMLVTAAGNSNDDACNYGPSNMGTQDGVIAVGALNYTNSAAEFSNFGTCVSVYAPGVSILSSSNDTSSSYKYTSGTSMSSPFVAGLASYFWSINSSYTIPELKDLIINYNNDQIVGLDSTTANRLAYNHM